MNRFIRHSQVEITNNYNTLNITLPVTVAERPKAVFARSEAGIVGFESNTRHGCLVCACVNSVFVLSCV
jgi:hypothetical protein